MLHASSDPFEEPHGPPAPTALAAVDTNLAGREHVNLARDFVGVAGRWSLEQHDVLHAQSIHLARENPVAAGKLDRLEGNWCLQLLRSDASTNPVSPREGRSAATAFCGSIWSVPHEAGESSYSAVRRLLLEGARRNDFSAVRSIGGDFTACVVQERRVYLLRGLTSTGSLFYRLTDAALTWSSSFMDIVGDPLAEIDVDALAYIAYGNNAIPYPGVSFVAPGEVVCLDGKRVTCTTFDAYPEIKPARLSLADWGHGIRERVEASVAARARRFRKVGLLLSGGIDSSALACCLAKAGVDIQCYHWSAQDFPVADETEHAKRVAEHLGIPIQLLDIGRYRLKDSQLIDTSWRFSVPNNHMLYRAWHDTARVAAGEVECLMTGRFADGLFNDSSPNFTISPFSVLHGMGLRPGAAFIWNALGVSLAQMRLRKGLVPKRNGNPLPSDRLQFYSEGGPKFLSPWRQMWHFTPEAQASVVAKMGAEGPGLLQTLALDLDEFWPRGLMHVTPYLDREVAAFAHGLPPEYLRLPYGGELLQKPALKRAFLDHLPPESIRRNNGVNVDTIVQSFWMNNRPLIGSLFSQESHLARMGIVDPARCRALGDDLRILQASAATVTVNAMVELWLRSLAREKSPC